MKPMPIKEVLQIKCPMGLNPKPTIELMMQSQFVTLPEYHYQRKDRDSVIVTVGDFTKPSIKWSMRRIKLVIMVILSGIVLELQQYYIHNRYQYWMLGNKLNNRIYREREYACSQKMNKHILDLLSRSMMVKTMIVTPQGWEIDAFGKDSEIKTLSALWRTAFPRVGTENNVIHIKGAGRWSTIY